jgi:hypothetical protein
MNLNEKLTDLTRQIVKLRDISKPCIICGCELFEPIEVCHCMKRRHIATTWELSNVNLGHKACNQREESSEVLQALHSKKYDSTVW